MEIPEHLLRRAQAAREKAEAENGAEPKIPDHLQRQRDATAINRAKRLDRLQDMAIDRIEDSLSEPIQFTKIDKRGALGSQEIMELRSRVEMLEEVISVLVETYIGVDPINAYHRVAVRDNYLMAYQKEHPFPYDD